ncbi:MAG: flagellar basal body rod protein FlgC, partial [Deltaproteobacteria bacterium]|nr:flagellar basal body rod protein FlgC [Deltaproteobacteria bacterium]
ISMNLANANTTRTADGTPYRRKTIILETTPIGVSFYKRLRDSLEKQINGVKVTEIVPVPG